MATTMDNSTSKLSVGELQRRASLIGGSVLLLYAMLRRSMFSMILAAVGGNLLYRGLMGERRLDEILGLTEPRWKTLPATVVPHNRGFRVDQMVTINKSPEELYRFWRNFENLPLFMSHLQAVKVLDDKRSHWVAKAPAGMTAEWDAEIINEVPGERIGWSSLETSDVNHAGSVQFKPLPHDAGTEVKVELKYDPPGSTLGAAFAKLFGKDPGQQILEDLHRFKQLMEAGEVSITREQPSRSLPPA
jgi:uncharacterized membrane protein